MGDYQEMWLSQNGSCFTCDDPLDGGKNTHVDHDHDTGLVRGLLCYECNSALGLTKENPGVLRAMADYLEHHKGAAILLGATHDQ